MKTTICTGLKINNKLNFLFAIATFTLSFGSHAQSIPTIDCTPNSIAQINTGQANTQNTALDKLWKFKPLLAYQGSDPANWSNPTAAYIVTSRTSSWTSTPANNSSAKWIGIDSFGSQPYFNPNPNAYGNVDGIFQVQFNIDSNVSLASFAPSMSFSADNSVVDIYINAQSQLARGVGTWNLPQAGTSNQFGYNGFGSGRWMTIPSMDSPNWVHGLNTMTVYVKSGVYNMGFAAAISGSATCKPNSAPSATPSINGQLQVGKTLSGTYIYTDTESDPENDQTTGTTYKWVISGLQNLTSSAQGSVVQSGTTLGVGSSTSYSIQASDVGQYIYYCVTPIAKTGTLVGSEACTQTSSLVTSPNQPPQAAPQIVGQSIVGASVTGTYVYTDAENDPENSSLVGSLFNWVVSTSQSLTSSSQGTIRSTGYTAGAASSVAYTVQSADKGNYLYYCVIPVASQGEIMGVEACALASDAIAEPPIATSPQSVPTLKAWAVIALSAFVAMFGFEVSRRRSI